MARVFKLVNVGPDFCAPTLIMCFGFAARSTTSVESDRKALRSMVLQFDENRAHFLYIFVFPDDVLVAQEISEAKFTGFQFSFYTGMKWSVFCPHLLRRV